jgi:hypothetical protein
LHPTPHIVSPRHRRRRHARHARLFRSAVVIASIVVFVLVASELVGIDYGDIDKVARYLYFHVVNVIDTARGIPGGRQGLETRLAFDNHDYPEHLIAQVWVDNEEAYVVDAHCAPDHCETAPLMMRRGRHTIRLRVVIGDRMSAFTDTTVDR